MYVNETRVGHAWWKNRMEESGEKMVAKVSAFAVEERRRLKLKRVVIWKVGCK